MQKIKCEMCGSNNVVKENGVYVCKNCGTQYSPEEAKKLLLEGTVKVDSSNQENSLIKRAYMELEDGKFIDARITVDKIMDLNPECADIYIINFLSDLGLTKFEELEFYKNQIDNNENYKKILEFGDSEIKEKLLKYNEIINDQKEKRKSKSKKIFIKVLSISACVVGFFLIVFFSVWFSSPLQYEKQSDGTYCVTGQWGPELGKIKIPEKHKNTTITSIGNGAFYRCDSLKSVTIPDSVTGIGKEAFSGCSSLTSITIPSSVTRIENEAFSDCSSLTGVTIPDSVTGIGKEAFSGCSSLKSITIPNSVTRIENEAFRYCSSLTSITIPDRVTSIGSSAFSGCSSLTSITFNGTKEKWQNIFKGSGWNYNVPATCKVICSDGTIGI